MSGRRTAQGSGQDHGEAMSTEPSSCSPSASEPNPSAGRPAHSSSFVSERRAVAIDAYFAIDEADCSAWPSDPAYAGGETTAPLASSLATRDMPPAYDSHDDQESQMLRNERPRRRNRPVVVAQGLSQVDADWDRENARRANRPIVVAVGLSQIGAEMDREREVRGDGSSRFEYASNHTRAGSDDESQRVERLQQDPANPFNDGNPRARSPRARSRTNYSSSSSDDTTTSDAPLLLHPVPRRAMIHPDSLLSSSPLNVTQISSIAPDTAHAAQGRAQSSEDNPLARENTHREADADPSSL